MEKHVTCHICQSPLVCHNPDCETNAQKTVMLNSSRGTDEQEVLEGQYNLVAIEKLTIEKCMRIAGNNLAHAGALLGLTGRSTRRALKRHGLLSGHEHEKFPRGPRPKGE